MASIIPGSIAHMSKFKLLSEEQSSILRNTGWLSNCSADFQDNVLKRGDVVKLNSGDELYREGKISRNIYGLIEGQIDVHLSATSGEVLVYPFSAPGRWYGLADVVAEVPAFGTAVAGRDSTAFRLTKHQMTEFLKEQPDRYREIVAHEFSLRRNIQETVIDLVTSDGLELVAKRLIRHMNFDGVDSSMPLSISQFEFASALGVSPPTVQRAFRELKKYGAIETSYGKIFVRDVDRLQDFVSTFSD